MPFHVNLIHFFSDGAFEMPYRETLGDTTPRNTYEQDISKNQCLPEGMKIQYEDISMYLDHFDRERY